jgi:uncharacterized protein (DUF1015 family)
MFPARVVRQEWARRTVTAMSESIDDSGVGLYPIRVDDAAYAESPVALYVYRQTGPDGSFVGVVCDVAVQAIAEGRVHAHEAVHQQRVEALLWHHATTDTPPALAVLLHRAGPAYVTTVAQVQQTPPLLDFPGPGGMQQTVWRLDEAAAKALADELAAADFYIADGHHRAAAGLEEWRRAGKPADAGLLCIVHTLDGLRLSAFHRRVPGPVSVETLLGLFSADFGLRETGHPPLPAVGTMGLYVGGRWFEITFTGQRPRGAEGLDVALLHSLVLSRLPARLDGRHREVETHPATSTVDTLVSRCDVDGGALVTVAPPPPEALVEVADAGEVMPPKTTFFEPKPATGIFLRL